MQKTAVLIDTNIFLDVFLQRSPFFDDARDILKLCEEQKVHGFLTASSITGIFLYIEKKPA